MLHLIQWVILLPFRLLWRCLRLVLRLMGVGGAAPVRTGTDYEKFVAGYLHRQGFHHIRHTGQTGDLGVDLVARKGFHTYAVQCKYYSSPVDGSAIQQVVAGMPCYGCDAALVVTNSTLTSGAWILAERNRVEVLTELSPLSELERFSLERFVSPSALVGFAAGCVLSCLALDQLAPQGLSNCIFVIVGCFLLSGGALALMHCLWRFLLGQ